MTEAVEQDQEVASTPEQDEAAFEAGFAEARGDEPPTPEPVAEEPVAAEPEPEATPEPEIVFAGLTEEQLKTALAKAGEVDELKSQVRQLFGRFGEVNSKLQSQNTQPVKVTAAQLKRLQANFPEFADDLAEDLSGLVLGGTSQSAFDPTELKGEFETRLKEIQKASEIKLLRMKHRDWEIVRDSSEFALWEQTLPDTERQELMSSKDAIYVSEQLDTFKAWRDKAQVATVKKRNRLENAVTPQGVPPTGPTTINDDDAFMSGFKAVRRGA
jgi:hypothetical protein